MDGDLFLLMNELYEARRFSLVIWLSRDWVEWLAQLLAQQGPISKIELFDFQSKPLDDPWVFSQSKPRNVNGQLIGALVTAHAASWVNAIKDQKHIQAVIGEYGSCFDQNMGHETSQWHEQC